MKIWGKIILAIAAITAAAVACVPFAVNEFFGDAVFDSAFKNSLSALPVSKGGRIMPMSSAATDMLRSSGGRSSAKIDGRRISATKWLWSLSADFSKYANLPLLRTDNRDLQKLLGANSRMVSYAAVEKNYNAIYAAASAKEGGLYAKSCAEILNTAAVFGVAAQSLCVDFPEERSFAEGLANWRKYVGDAEREFAESAQNKRKIDNAKLVPASLCLNFLRAQAAFENDNKGRLLLCVPTVSGFETPAAVLLNRQPDDTAKAVLMSFAKIADAVAADKTGEIGAEIDGLFGVFAAQENVDMFRVRLENIFNAADPFFAGLVLYGLSLAFFAFSPLKKESAAVAAVFLSAAVLLHVSGICVRSYIQLRPPITNFYSSVVFTGAMAASLALAAYMKKRSALTASAGALAGVLSLIVAVNLPHSGDTMGMMRAVLNSNFWLSAHVMTIMLGYCGLFLTGFAASLRLVGNAFSKTNFGMATSKMADAVYVSLCVCLLFTFAGTMLGGVWADMSWGRFWGWDPKENGALMVVLWTAAAIHCKALKVCNDRFFLALAALGNVVVAWAWFGVNLLGVGLHSYGFIDGGWLWLGIFIFLQIIVAPFALLVYKDANNI